jgi:hypothetical protein
MSPRWNSNGKELFYLFAEGMAVEVRFLMAAPSTDSAGAQPPITVVTNWTSLLKK